MRNIDKGDLLLYKDQQGKFTLYKCIDVDTGKKPTQYVVELDVAHNMEGFKSKHIKKFTTSMRTKEGSRRLFKFWLTFDISYTFFRGSGMIKGVLKNYYYSVEGELIFNVQKSNGQLAGFTVEQLKNVEYA